MNKKLYILVAVLAVLLAVTIGLIVALRPAPVSDIEALPSAEAVQTVEPTAAPETATLSEPLDASDPLAGLSEEEMAALAMAEESYENSEGDNVD